MNCDRSSITMCHTNNFSCFQNKAVVGKLRHAKYVDISNYTEPLLILRL